MIELNDEKVLKIIFSACFIFLDFLRCHTRTLVLPRNDGEDKKGSGFTRTGFGQQDITNL